MNKIINLMKKISISYKDLLFRGSGGKLKLNVRLELSIRENHERKI